MMNKKGAMFGLDARIALAIFGALSVISGAALYSAIQQAKTVRQVVEFNEIAKACEQYYLDVGENLPKTDTGGSILIGNLMKNYAGVSGWKGPYLPTSFAKSSSSSEISANITDQDMMNNYLLIASRGSKWLGDITAVPTSCLDFDCAAYLTMVVTLDDKALKYADKVYNRLDDYIDGSDGPRLGKVRGYSGASGKAFFIFYKVMNLYK